MNQEKIAGYEFGEGCQGPGYGCNWECWSCSLYVLKDNGCSVESRVQELVTVGGGR